MTCEPRPVDDSLHQRRARSRERLQRYTRLLDDAIRLPGTNIRFGADAVIGLVPVVGDFAGVALSSVVFAEAVRLRAPRKVLMRMGGNMATDFVVGLVPVVGDIFDVAWRANRRNLRLLEDWLDAEHGAGEKRRWPAATLGLGLLAGAGLISLLLWRALGG